MDMSLSYPQQGLQVVYLGEYLIFGCRDFGAKLPHLATLTTISNRRSVACHHRLEIKFKRNGLILFCGLIAHEARNIYSKSNKFLGK